MFVPIQYPWEAVSAMNNIGEISENNRITANWNSQIVAGKDVSITSAATGSEFPTSILSEELKILELPGPTLKGDTSRAIVLDYNNAKQIEFTYYTDSIQEMNSQQKFEHFFDRTMNVMLFILRKDCLNVNYYKSKNIYWDELLKLLHANPDDDPAKYALVVDLAELSELSKAVDRITDQPKRMLQRIHDQERVQKVREVDTKCLIDLARRPGSVLSEKAGPKQRILAIKRKENINIMENRVTKHCCALAVKASERYLIEHKDIHKSKRKESVVKLQKECKRYPLKPTFTDVFSLAAPCRQPNYTLMQNADYYKVWKSYVQLVKNEDLRAQLWQWNRRMWTDFIALFLVDILSGFRSAMKSEYFLEINQKTVFGNRKHDSGLWFLSDVLPGPYIVEPNSNNPGTLYFINGDHDSIIGISDSLSELTLLNADYIFIFIRNEVKTVLPVYGIIPSFHYTIPYRNKYVGKMLPSLSKNISAFNNISSEWVCKNGWVLHANWENTQVNDKHQNLGKGIKCYAHEVDPDYHTWPSNRENYFEPLLNLIG